MSDGAAVVHLSADFRLSGDAVGFAQADALRRQGEVLIREQEGPLRVDLEGLDRANTLAVAVMLSWFRAARRLDKRIEFVNLSSEMRNIIRFSGLDTVLLAEHQPAPSQESV